MLSAAGGYLDEGTDVSSETFNVYNTTSVDSRSKSQKDFWPQLKVEYEENEWYSFLVDYLRAELFGDLVFVGPGAPAVYKFFEKTCPAAWDEIESMGLNGVREGTGIIRKHKKDGSLAEIQCVDVGLLTLQEDTPREVLTVTVAGNTDLEWKVKIWGREAKDYNHPEFALCRLKRVPGTPYGQAFGRSCFHAIKGLKGINRDIIAALKHLMANVAVVETDLSGCTTEAEQKAQLTSVATSMSRLATATTGVLAIDNRHKLYYPGSGFSGGSGGKDSRLVAAMEHLEPVLSCVLMNFGMAIGIIEQTGANKSLISRQEVKAIQYLNQYKRGVERFFETQIIPDITNEECWCIHERQMETQELFNLYTAAGIPREYLWERLGISRGEDLEKDDGTYVYDIQTRAADALLQSKEARKAGGRGAGYETAGTGNDDRPAVKKEK